MKRKKMVFVLMFFIVSVGLAGFSSVAFPQEKMRLKFWHHEPVDYRMAAFQEVVDRFEAKNPGIHLVQEAIPWDDTWAKLAAAIKSGTAPDFQWDNPPMNIFAYEGGGILPVTDIVEEVDKRYGYYESLKKPYYHDGEYWGVPIWHIPHALVYHPSYFREYLGTTEPPKNWKELLEYAKKLTIDKDGDGVAEIYGIAMAAGKSFCTQEQFWDFMAPAGASIFDEDGKVSFYSPEAIRALEFYAELAKYEPPGVTGWSWGEIEMNLPAGTMAMTPYYGAGLKLFWEEENYDIACTEMPYPEDGQKGALLHPEGIMVFKTAKERGHLDAVKSFILFAMAPENHWILTAKQEPGLYYPSTRAQLDAPYFWDYEPHAKYPDFVKTLAEVVEYGSTPGFTYGAVNLTAGRIYGANVLADMVQRVLLLGESAEKAVKWAHDRMVKMSK